MPKFEYVMVIEDPKFPLGIVVVTENALATLDHETVREGLFHHERGDWGQIPPEDATSNEYSLEHGGRLLSVYGQGSKRFWIISESDRSVTTVLMPLDY